MNILELNAVTKAYGESVVLNSFSFGVKEGELRCLLGPNGAGKTTAMDIITGRQKINSGVVKFDNKDITGLSEHEIVRLGISRKFQVPAVFKDLSVRENLEVAFSREKGPFANMRGIGRIGERSRYDEVIDLIDFGDRLKTTAGLLSHGETQWLEIGMVLMQNPRLLLMDEPTAGMTEQETYKTSQIFNFLKGNHTLIVVEHDMSFVKEIADIITVMHMGELFAEGSISEIEKNQQVKEVYLGTRDISYGA